MTMPDADLNLITRQYHQIITDVGQLRDENRVLTAMVTRLEEAQPRTLDQLRALQSLIGRMDERFRKWETETDGMPPERVVDAIANRLQARLLPALSDLIFAKLLVVLDERIDKRFTQILKELAALRPPHAGDAGGGA
jgi:hypothetical protein